MKIELHTTLATFDALASEWDSVLAPERSNHLFMTYAWQRTWWKHLGQGKLCIGTARDDNGVLCGIGPRFIEQDNDQRVVRAIGCAEVSDYTDLILKSGHEEVALGALLDFMLSDEAPDWDYFTLCNVPQDTPTRALLSAWANTRRLAYEETLADVCPIVELPNHYDDYLASLDKKQRHELRRKRRRADGHGTGWYTVGDEHRLGLEIDAFLELMAMSTSAKANFLKEPGHRAFFREMGQVMFERGLLDLNFLTIDGVRVATVWQFAYRNRMLLYNSGMDTEQFSFLSPGIVLLTYSIEAAIERGFKIYDFLRGDEAYKYHMGAKDTMIYNVVIRR